MKSSRILFVFALLSVQSALGATKDDIARLDQTLVRACEVAETNFAKAKDNALEEFLRVLSLLENQYQTSNNQEGLLACRYARGKYDAKSEQVAAPAKIPEQLTALLAAMDRRLESLLTHKTKTIAEAKERRTRNLTALQRGLAERGDKAGAQLVAAALASTPQLPQPSTTPKAGTTLVPQAVEYLTYNRPQKRWEKFDGAGVVSEASEQTTKLHYAQGAHPLLKVLWPDVLEVGDRFTIELQGANSIEVVDLEGADANARSSLPTADKFVKVEIVREKDQITFICDGQAQKTFYASGALRGDAAKSALAAAKLRFGISIRKDASASFRQAKIVRP